jgi:hypothetical protein
MWLGENQPRFGRLGGGSASDGSKMAKQNASCVIADFQQLEDFQHETLID